MTVKELIEQLSQLNENAKVYAVDHYGEITFEIGGIVYNDDTIHLEASDD